MHRGGVEFCTLIAREGLASGFVCLNMYRAYERMHVMEVIMKSVGKHDLIRSRMACL